MRVFPALRRIVPLGDEKRVSVRHLRMAAAGMRTVDGRR
jgi:hypothetical protein